MPPVATTQAHLDHSRRLGARAELRRRADLGDRPTQPGVDHLHGGFPGGTTAGRREVRESVDPGIGRNFDLAVLEPAAGIDPDTLLDALEEAEGAQLITSATSGRDATYTFSHELIRQTLHGNLSLPRRQRLHLRIANAVESTRGDDTEPGAALLAHHLFQAGSIADAAKTLGYLSTAGRQALAAAAFEEAVAHFTSALTLERLDGKVRADLLYARGRALRSLAQADDAIADWEEALTGYEALGDAAGMARTVWDLGWTFIWHDRAADGLAVAERTERVVPDQTTAERSRTLAILGALRGWVGDYTTFEQRIGEARRIAEQLVDNHLLGQVLVLETTMYWMFAKTGQTVRTGREAVKALRATDDAWELPQVLAVLSLGLVYSGAPEQSDRTAGEAQRIAARVGHDGALATATLARLSAGIALTGDMGSAEQVTPDLVAIYERSGPWSRAPLISLSMTRFMRGAWDEAGSAIDQALARGGGPNCLQPSSNGPMAGGSLCRPIVATGPGSTSAPNDAVRCFVRGGRRSSATPSW